MAGNSFGQVFRITTFGESHGRGLGVIIDGCPPGVEVDEDFILAELARRRPGQSAIVTQRKERMQGRKITRTSKINFVRHMLTTPTWRSMANATTVAEDALLHGRQQRE